MSKNILHDHTSFSKANLLTHSNTRCNRKNKHKCNVYKTYFFTSTQNDSSLSTPRIYFISLLLLLLFLYVTRVINVLILIFSQVLSTSILIPPGLCHQIPGTENSFSGQISFRKLRLPGTRHNCFSWGIQLRLPSFLFFFSFFIIFELS